MRTFRTLVLVALAISVAGCGAGDGTDSGSDTSVSLDGMAFRSTSVSQDGEPFDLAKGTVISISFVDGRLSANTGCNTIGGGYQLRDGALVVDGQLASTEMACDHDRMDQDQWFIDFLGDSPKVVQSSDNLTLSTDATTIEFIDEKVANPDQPLTETEWKLDGIVTGDAISSVPGDVKATLTFGTDGQVHGNFGCNSGGGQYQATDTVITFASIASTLMACPGDPSDVESTVLQVLDGAVDYTIDGSQLTLTNGDLGLTFRAA